MNIGIIGLGFMGATHAGTISRMDGVRVGAVAARNDRLLNGDFSEVGGNLGNALPNVDLTRAAKYHDWTELIADPSIEAVDICLPTDLHERVSLAALAAGKHVLCEKPMALSAAGCDNMLRAAGQAKRILMIGHVLRFWPAYTQLGSFIAAGENGAVTSATFTRYCGVPDWSSWLPKEERSGGAVLDLLIHDLDQILLLFGPPAALRAKALGNEDAVTATFLYPNGPEVRLQGGWLAAGTPFSMGFQVQAERAQIELTPKGLTVSDLDGRQKSTPIEEADPFTAELSYFRECCEAGRKPDRCPPEQSAAAVKLALLVKQSRSLDGEEVTCAL